MTAMKYLLVGLVTLTSLSAAQRQQTFTGTISDEMCAGVGHVAMRMDPSDAECARLCVMSHGSLWVLEVGKEIYNLSDQTTPASFAAQRVRVVGTLDAKSKTITVSSIAAATTTQGKK
jgi:hypothetical protein